MQFQWVPPHCGVMGNEMGRYFGKECTTTSRTFACKLSLHSDTSRTFACKLSLHSDKLKIKPNIQADLSRYYAKESQHNSWNKMDKNRNKIPNFTREDTFRQNSGQHCVNDHLCSPSIYPFPMCVLQRDDNPKTNLHHLPNHTFDRWEYSVTCKIILGC